MKKAALEIRDWGKLKFEMWQKSGVTFQSENIIV